MIQNMKNIKSKFRMDQKYFSQHLVNSNRFNEKSDLRILLKMQKMRFFAYTKFSHPLNQNPGVFSIKMCSRSFGTN